jgi:hypothetical protein
MSFGIRRFAALVGAFFVVTAVSAQTIYTTHGDGTRFGTINAATGVGTDVGATGVSEGWALARDPNGTLYTTYNGFSGNAQLATINPATGAIAATIGGVGTSLIALELDGSGQLWGVGYNDQILYRINKATGAATAVGNTGVSNVMDLAFDASGVLYATVNNVLYRVNTATGATTVAANITGIASGSVMGIMFDTSGTLYATAYVTNSPLYRINVATGAATAVGNTGFDFPHGGDIAGAAAAPTVVPTLSGTALLLLAIAIGASALLARRRSRT